jgi:hypothetical protein
MKERIIKTKNIIDEAKSSTFEKNHNLIIRKAVRSEEL